ncbi:MAG: helix-turn-helix transcriptional regulator [Candidatus Eremiobacteraeota bacterium]|nr:helix-turn-helix transcriptional regulator [Candidatus Eremiobacteraeota bacterium]MBC5827867.1 helix-turn-helix transcriptional regulator [Candidatus Eremiobacteraeota bacterium]
MTKKTAPQQANASPLALVARDLGAVEAAVRVIGGKWKIMILFHLHGGPLRFSELSRRMPLVSKQSLTVQLRELERDCVIKRSIFPEVPPRVEYGLTKIGTEISPLMPLLMKWGYEILRIRG